MFLCMGFLVNRKTLILLSMSSQIGVMMRDFDYLFFCFSPSFMTERGGWIFIITLLYFIPKFYGSGFYVSLSVYLANSSIFIIELVFLMMAPRILSVCFWSLLIYTLIGFFCPLQLPQTSRVSSKWAYLISPQLLAYSICIYVLSFFFPLFYFI